MLKLRMAIRMIHLSVMIFRNICAELLIVICSVKLYFVFILCGDVDADIFPGWQVRPGCAVPACLHQEPYGHSAPELG